MVVLGAATAAAQYKEMNKVESLARSNSEQQMLAGMSSHLGVPADTLKQEMTANNLNFGQLYLAHAIAKSANVDVATIFSDSKSKLWTTIAEERKVDMKQISTGADELEKTIKNLKNASK
jgi:hypothetical protein